MTEMTALRAMTAADLPDVLALRQLVREVALNESNTPEQLTKYLARNPELSPVVVQNGGVVGAVLYCHDRGGHDGRRGYHHLAVAAPYRQQDLGTALVEHCLTHLSRVGISKCNAFVLPDNSSGRAFWQQMQFQEKPWPLWQRSFDGAA
jgi:ribosomal protein S18 acetylase RimI-like enzyme